MQSWFGYKSRFTGEPCICVITGSQRASENPKTGEMLQVWFLLRNVPPHEAVRHRCDRGICGTCPLKGGNGCYVRVEQAPLAVWKKWKAGDYDDVQLKADEERCVRFGAYGDPASMPAVHWKALIASLCPERWTGYTHGWRKAPWLKPWCMASVEYMGDGQKAYAQGWSIFEVTATLWQIPEKFLCSNVAHGTQCINCLKCDGAHAPHGQRWVEIPAHGFRQRLIHGQ